MNLTLGHISRHTPAGSGSQGREAALIDIAQDLLLDDLFSKGFLDKVAIKGGTGIRKLYAGKEGRFSIDLDFSVSEINTNTEDIALEFASMVDGLEIDGFTFSVSERRGKWYVGFKCKFNSDEILKTKLDFAPAPWLNPVRRSWVPLPIHDCYNHQLPEIKTVRLEENIAEKIARLNRTTTARDLYDLNWIMENVSVCKNLDKNLIRRLVVLKIWCDSNGIHCEETEYRKAHSSSVFNPEYWLRERSEKEVDLEDIGTLAVPTPSVKNLVDRLRKNYEFLKELDEKELVIANSDERDRKAVLQALKELPDNRFQKLLLF